MRLWLDDAQDAAEHMRRDAALLRDAEDGAPPVLRLFTFDPPGITLGRGQRPERELDLDRCRADGIAWAIRPTGGRAIFHADSWTYALAAPRDHPEWSGSLHDAYAHASRLILDGLVRLGVPARLAPGTSRHASADGQGSGSAAAPCFASTARHEIVLGGAKLVGSAQRRTARAVLQQGSVLLGPGHLRLVDYLAVPDDDRPRLREALRGASAEAGPFLGGQTGIRVWAEALLAGLPPDASLRREAPARWDPPQRESGQPVDRP